MLKSKHTIFSVAKQLIDSATRRSRVNLQGDEIAALKSYLNLCEYYRKIDPATVQEEYRSRSIIFRAIYIALEYLILYSIDLINLIEAFSFAEEAQDAGYYRTTILKHICIHIDDLDKRFNEQVTGKDFQNAIGQICATFSNADSLRVPDNFNRLRKAYNKRMATDRQYIHEIRNKIVAHTDSDIDVYINVNKSLDAERIRVITHYTLSFVTGFSKTFDPLIKEALQGQATQ